MSSNERSARALFFTAPETVELRETELASSEDGVLVESELIGVSHGTEMLIYRGAFPSSIEEETVSSLAGRQEYPLKYGYVNVGRTQDGHLVFAFFPHQDRFRCREEDLVYLPADLRAEDAVFLASMETAVGIVHDAVPRLGETVLVLGQGVVGLLVTELLLRTGVARVIAADPLPQRRERAAALGAQALDPEEPEAVARTIAEATEGRGVDTSINVSSSSAALQHALDHTVFEGTVVEASWYGTRPVELELGRAFHRRRLHLRSSQVSNIDPALRGRWSKARRLHFAVELLRELAPSKYITHRFELGRADEAFRLLKQHPEHVLQIVLTP
jgi:threonine dehydrogenase-like Zn-dependent dehydrogenase